MTVKNMAELQEDKNIPKQSKEDSQMSKPTPTPWKIEKAFKPVHPIEGFILKRDDDVRHPVALVTKEANAAFIVRAVNAHQELVDMVKTYKGWISDSRRLVAINDLLAKAEGR